jgi:hypothetical protein
MILGCKGRIIQPDEAEGELKELYDSASKLITSGIKEE